VVGRRVVEAALPDGAPPVLAVFRAVAGRGVEAGLRAVVVSFALAGFAVVVGFAVVAGFALAGFAVVAGFVRRDACVGGFVAVLAPEVDRAVAGRLRVVGRLGVVSGAAAAPAAGVGAVFVVAVLAAVARGVRRLVVAAGVRAVRRRVVGREVDVGDAAGVVVAGETGWPLTGVIAPAAWIAAAPTPLTAADPASLAADPAPLAAAPAAFAAVPAPLAAVVAAAAAMDAVNRATFAASEVTSVAALAACRWRLPICLRAFSADAS
jgi:hypothetical protein